MSPVVSSNSSFEQQQFGDLDFGSHEERQFVVRAHRFGENAHLLEHPSRNKGHPQVVIGIPTQAIFDPYGLDCQGERQYVVDFAREGALAEKAVPAIVLLPMTDNEHELRAAYELCDAILNPGGDDLCPVNYGQEPSERLGKTNPLEDQTELQLADWSFSEGKPYLGICRGMQVGAVALGGDMIQHIADEYGPKIGYHHAAETDRPGAWELHDGVLEELQYLKHGMSIRRGSRLHQYLADGVGDLSDVGVGEFSSHGTMVNSLHHQAVVDVGPELTVAGIPWIESEPAGDFAEAYESPTHPFYIGVQYHPEFLGYQGRRAKHLPLMQGLVRAAIDTK